MDTKDQIRKWIEEDQDFYLGVNLYAKCKFNKRLLSRFMEKGPDDYNMGKLRHELKKFLPFKASSIIRTTPKAFNPPVRSQHHTQHHLIVEEINAPPAINAIIAERNKLYRERDHLHAQLTYISKSERYKFAKRIMELTDKIDTCWLKLDKYRNKGSAPVHVEPIPPEDIAKKMRRIQNLRTYITRYQKKLQAPPDMKSKESWTEKLQTFKNELETLLDETS